jgi:proteasome alpha subunit
MSMPYYVSPEQIIADKAEFARKGIARGRSVIVASAVDAIYFVADNPSRALHKIGEIYDRIGFAAVGRYNEFENLRVAGVRLADTRGYSYDRTDVTVRTIANAYAQTLGSIFIEAAKPFEVEIAVAQVGENPGSDQLYRISFDGSVHDQAGYISMGGDSETVGKHMQENWSVGASAKDTLTAAVKALYPDAEPDIATLEVATLRRSGDGRRFNRCSRETITELLG